MRRMTTSVPQLQLLQKQIFGRRILLPLVIYACILLSNESSTNLHSVYSFVLQPLGRPSRFHHKVPPHHDRVLFHRSSMSSSKKSIAASKATTSVISSSNNNSSTNTTTSTLSDTTEGNNSSYVLSNNATTTSNSNSNTTTTTNATTTTSSSSSTTTPLKKQPSLLFANRLRNSYLENLLLVNTTRPIRYQDAATTTSSSSSSSKKNKKNGGGKDNENDTAGEIQILVVRPPMLYDVFPNLVGSTQDTDEFDLYEYLNGDFGDSSVGAGIGSSDNTENTTSASNTSSTGSWAVIFMHPGDFTPVCTTELGQAALMQAEFDKRNVKLIGFSCNDANAHRKWLEDVYIVTGGRVTFPIFCDDNRQVATRLGILDPTNADANSGLPLTVRSVYILNPDKTIALIMTYPASTGRNMKELLRCIDAVQLTSVSQVATPVNWNRGDECLVDLSLNDEQADQVFGVDGYRIIKVPSEVGLETRLPRHYMRYTKDPSAGFVRRMIQKMLQRPKPPKQ